MIVDFSDYRFFLRPGRTDLRKGINGLSRLIQNTMQNDPFSKSLFLFCNKQHKLLKIVYWDRNGFCLWLVGACGSEKTCIGEDVSERACLIPAKVVVRREKRKKYVCRKCEGTTDDESGVVTAEGPKHLIPGSIADESLLAWSINEKFEYALPFYRQSKRLQSIGIPIPRATLGNLFMQSADTCGILRGVFRLAADR